MVTVSTKAEDYKLEISRLVKDGLDLIRVIGDKEDGKKNSKTTTIGGDLKSNLYTGYPMWYTEASEVVRRLLPDRLDEFISLYKPSANRKEVTVHNYSIQDWILGNRAKLSIRDTPIFDDKGLVASKMLAQVMILQSSILRFDSILLNMKQLTLADMFDSELDGARELLKAGFLRPAGVVAGVVLEKHLKELCASNSVKITKKKPQIADYNEALKENNVFDIPPWRNVGHLADIRNLCAHDKEREPTKEEVSDLIIGVESIIKTTY